ncbi:MAG: hypothetical protein HQL63_10705, partial [Magnetococcales bacterium]|nr:hypothetical protein [Magnetococcales bacterium]
MTQPVVDSAAMWALLDYWEECGLHLAGVQRSANRPVPGLRTASPARQAEERIGAVEPKCPASMVDTSTGALSVGPAPIPGGDDTAAGAVPATRDAPPAGAALSVVPASETMADIARQVVSCTQCRLAQTRTQTVFGTGSMEAPVVFVGEGPGEDEDLQGEPFVGQAGKLLNRMVQAAGMARESIYIANVVKCRPPGNRNPLPEEMAACQGFLFRQLLQIQPRVIFAMGKTAIVCLLGLTTPVSQVRGKIHDWRGIPVIPSYHPAYYLRQPGQKKAGWVDLLRLIKMLRDVPSARQDESGSRGLAPWLCPGQRPG